MNIINRGIASKIVNVARRHFAKKGAGKFAATKKTISETRGHVYH